jgi:hypothetical protein
MNPDPQASSAAPQTGHEPLHALKIISAPARCRECSAVYQSPTSGRLRNDCGCGGELVAIDADEAARSMLRAWDSFVGNDRVPVEPPIPSQFDKPTTSESCAPQTGREAETVPVVFAREIERELVTLRAENAALKAEVAHKQKLIQNSCEDWAEDDTRIKELAKPFGIDVEGDSYAVPTMVDVVECMAKLLTKVQAEMDRDGRLYNEQVVALQFELVEARKLAGTMSELHAKGEAAARRLRDALEEAEKFFAGGLESAGFNMNNSVKRIEYLKIEVRLGKMRAALAGTAPDGK